MLGILFLSNNTPYFGRIQVAAWWVSYCQQQTKVATEFRTNTSSGLVGVVSCKVSADVESAIFCNCEARCRYGCKKRKCHILAKFEFFVSHETRAPHLFLEMFTGHFCGASVPLHVQRYGTNGCGEKTTTKL